MAAAVLSASHDSVSMELFSRVTVQGDPSASSSSGFPKQGAVIKDAALPTLSDAVGQGDRHDARAHVPHATHDDADGATLAEAGTSRLVLDPAAPGTSAGTGALPHRTSYDDAAATAKQRGKNDVLEMGGRTRHERGSAAPSMGSVNSDDSPESSQSALVQDAAFASIRDAGRSIASRRGLERVAALLLRDVGAKKTHEDIHRSNSSEMLARPLDTLTNGSGSLAPYRPDPPAQMPEASTSRSMGQLAASLLEKAAARSRMGTRSASMGAVGLFVVLLAIAGAAAFFFMSQDKQHDTGAAAGGASGAAEPEANEEVVITDRARVMRQSNLRAIQEEPEPQQRKDQPPEQVQTQVQQQQQQKQREQLLLQEQETKKQSQQQRLEQLEEQQKSLKEHHQQKSLKEQHNVTSPAKSSGASSRRPSGASSSEKFPSRRASSLASETSAEYRARVDEITSQLAAMLKGPAKILSPPVAASSSGDWHYVAVVPELASEGVAPQWEKGFLGFWTSQAACANGLTPELHVLLSDIDCVFHEAGKTQVELEMVEDSGLEKKVLLFRAEQEAMLWTSTFTALLDQFDENVSSRS